MLVKKILFTIFVCLISLYIWNPVTSQASEFQIIEQSDSSIVAESGRYVYLHVNTNGTNVSYQWYRKFRNTSDWRKWDGKTSAEHTLKMKDIWDGMQVKCMATKESETIETGVSTIFLCPRPGSAEVGGSHSGMTTFLDMDFASVNLLSGEYFQANLKENTELRYQWYYQNKGDNEWIEWTGMNSCRLKQKVDKSWDGRKIKCMISSMSGYTADSTVIDLCVYGNSEGIDTCKEISLYTMNETWAPYISIPADKFREYNTGDGGAKVLVGSSVQINQGVVSPVRKQVYAHQVTDSSYWVKSDQPSGVEGEVVLQEYVYGSSYIMTTGGDIVKVNVVEYANEYAEEVMKDYMDRNIDDSMTDYEKMEICCQFVAAYDYEKEHSSYTGMIVTGGGDCRASAGALAYMLGELGIQSVSRNAAYIDGAGSGHENVIACASGKYYVLEAGYEGKAPRHYSIREFNSVYSYKVKNNGTACITQYIGIQGVRDIKIPDTIDGYEVTEIGEGAFRGLHEVKSITVPASVLSIGKQAFMWDTALEDIFLPDNLLSIGIDCFCYDSCLKKIRIPASVEELGDGAFLYCESLEEIEVEKSNMYYTSEEGVLFNYHKSELIVYPAGKKSREYNAPGTVQTIHTWAFAGVGHNNKQYLKELLLPRGVKNIEEYAFCETSLDELAIPDTVSVIKAYSFKYTAITEIVLPDTLTVIEDYAFYRAIVREINLPDSLESIGEYAFAGNLCLNIRWVPTSVKIIGDHAFDFGFGWFSMGKGSSSSRTYYSYVCFPETINSDAFGTDLFSSCVVGVIKDSPIYKYATENNVPYVCLNSQYKIPMQETYITGVAAKCDTEGDYVVDVQWNDTIPFPLIKNRDYVISVEEQDGGESVISSIRGIGFFSGSIEKKAAVAKSASLKKTFSIESIENTSSGVCITWEACKNASGYTISYFRKNDEASARAKQGGNNTQKILDWSCFDKGDLYKGEVYIFYIVAYKNMRSIGICDEIEFMVKRPEEDSEDETVKFSSGGVDYKLTDKGAVVIGGNKRKKKVVIPNIVKYKGIEYKVRIIAPKAFYRNTAMRKVFIGRNVGKIGEKAFYGCYCLKRIKIRSKKLQLVGKGSFKYVNYKVKLTAPKGKYKKYKKMMKL